jgi:hypothetical protein
MSNIISCTLVGDGSSDKILLSPLRWLLDDLYPDRTIEISFADLRQSGLTATNLAERVQLSLRLFPCDLLFIHRDAEGETYERRITEIQAALHEKSIDDQVYLPVIPTRMTEAWFLHDAQAIRTAADNPNGKANLNLPSPVNLHKIPDPKRQLEELLITASELNKRRLKNFKPRKRMHRLAELMDDFSLLRSQESFRQLEEGLENLRTTIFL